VEEAVEVADVVGRIIEEEEEIIEAGGVGNDMTDKKENSKASTTITEGEGEDGRANNRDNVTIRIGGTVSGEVGMPGTGKKNSRWEDGEAMREVVRITISDKAVVRISAFEFIG